MNVIDTAFFDVCFLFHEITGIHIFDTSLLLSRGILQPSCMCVQCALKQVL